MRARVKEKFRYDCLRGELEAVWRCPTCGKQTDAVAEELPHRWNCPNRQRGFEACVFVFGPKLVVRTIKAANQSGDESTMYGGLSVSFLKQHFPELM